MKLKNLHQVLALYNERQKLEMKRQSRAEKEATGTASTYKFSAR